MKPGRLRRVAPNLVLLASTLAVMAVLLEVGVRLFVDFEEYKPIPVLGVDPAKPIAFLPNQQRVYETSEFRYTASFNRFGRRDVEWSPEVMADPANVLMIGDSFVLGNAVEDEASVPTRLEAALAARGEPREVFNFGMAACGPPVYLELLHDALDSGIAARTVVVGVFVGNDFYPDQLPERRKPVAPRASPGTSSLPRSELLRFLRLRVSQSPRLVGWALRLSGMLGISVYDTAGSYIFLRDPTQEQKEVFDALLAYVARMQDVAEAHGRRLLMVVFPNKIQVENHEALTSSVFDAARPDERILAFCAERGLACLDLLPVLREAFQDGHEHLYFPVDRHMTPEGNRVAAAAIAQFLVEQASAILYDEPQPSP